jgi:hypothetical protein
MTNSYRHISFHLQYLFNISCSTQTHFTSSLRYLFNDNRSNVYSQRVAVSCEVKKDISTLKSSVFTTINCSPTRRYIFLEFFVLFCFLKFGIFCPISLNPNIKPKVSRERRQHIPLPHDQH